MNLPALVRIMSWDFVRVAVSLGAFGILFVTA
ncbi:MAG: hypothetical protein H6Q33_3584, partial [Deltaproteobacteria bacterium]|nr:hypothetical protein [Deltaproteobacteria bacterium]